MGLFYNAPEPTRGPANRRRPTTTAVSKKGVARKWCKDDLPPSAAAKFEASSQVSQSVEEDFRPTVWFEQFFSDDLVQLMVNESTSYAEFRGNRSVHGQRRRNLRISGCADPVWLRTTPQTAHVLAAGC